MSALIAAIISWIIGESLAAFALRAGLFGAKRVAKRVAAKRSDKS